MPITLLLLGVRLYLGDIVWHCSLSVCHLASWCCRLSQRKCDIQNVCCLPCTQDALAASFKASGPAEVYQELDKLLGQLDDPFTRVLRADDAASFAAQEEGKVGNSSSGSSRNSWSGFGDSLWTRAATVTAADAQKGSTRFSSWSSSNSANRQ